MKLALPALARHYDALAAQYDALGVDDPATYWRHTATNVVLTRAEAEPDDVVLDLGCGTGNVARTLAPHVRRVVGVDCSPAMLARARIDAPPNITWLQGDLRSPPRVPELQIVTACYALHTLERSELKSLFSNVFQALQPNGLFVMGDLFWTVPPDQVEGAEGWLDPAVGYAHRAWDLLAELEAVGFQVALTPLHPVVSVLAALRP